MTVMKVLRVSGLETQCFKYQDTVKKSMEFFIRRYQKGIRGSGTSDVFVSKTPISQTEFENICTSIGMGKYNLCVRGKGIKGFKKMSDYVVSEEKLVFNADEIVSVQQNLPLSSLSEKEIMDLMGDMIQKSPNDMVGQDKFMADLKRFHAELDSRKNAPTPQTNFEAQEGSIVGAGFSVGRSIPSFALGVVAGGVLVYLLNKSTIDALKQQVDELNKSIKDAESSLNTIKKNAESINNPFSPQNMLSKYNQSFGIN